MKKKAVFFRAATGRINIRIELGDPASCQHGSDIEPKQDDLIVEYADGDKAHAGLATQLKNWFPDLYERVGIEMLIMSYMENVLSYYQQRHLTLLKKDLL